MIKINVAAVRTDIKAFQKFSDNHINEAIQQAFIQADTDNIPSDNNAYPVAVLNFARHLLVVDLFTDSGNVMSSNTLGNSESVANPNTYDDQYLKNYQRIADQIGDTSENGEIEAFNGESNNNGVF